MSDTSRHFDGRFRRRLHELTANVVQRGAGSLGQERLEQLRGRLGIESGADARPTSFDQIERNISEASSSANEP